MTFEEFCQFISDHTHTPMNQIQASASFRDDLGIDSLQLVNLIVGLTEAMKTGMDSISGSDDLATVGQLYRSLSKDVVK